MSLRMVPSFFQVGPQSDEDRYYPSATSRMVFGLGGCDDHPAIRQIHILPTQRQHFARAA
ncbi:MAG TPA: hypothetical protein PL064_03025 [Thermogutta sp.]|nr:hypothetical protein [Thermogutta sp.]